MIQHFLVAHALEVVVGVIVVPFVGHVIRWTAWPFSPSK